MTDTIPAQSTAIQRATPADLLRIALESNADLDRLERLMALQTQWEAAEAKKAYVAAMAAFKKNPPVILKQSRVNFKNKEGRVTDYMHATLGDVTAPVIEGLAAVGISHRWQIDQPDGGLIAVTCILTHEAGHSESVTMRAGRDDSGGKNAIQQVASTITYLERYTLLSITGLATHDMPDDDGRASAPPAAPLPPTKLADVLTAYTEATTPEHIAAADEKAGALPTEADKAMARQRRKERLKTLREQAKEAAAAPADTHQAEQASDQAPQE